jgi:hypothetical protein
MKQALFKVISIITQMAKIVRMKSMRLTDSVRGNPLRNAVLLLFFCSMLLLFKAMKASAA